MMRKTRALWMVVALASCLGLRDAGAADPTIAGSWVTDTVVIAKDMQTQLKKMLADGAELDPLDDSPVAEAYRNQMATRRNSGAGTLAGTSGTRTTSVDRSGGFNSGGTGGGGFNGGGARSGGGGGGTGGGGGGGGRRGGNNFLPAGRQEEKRGASSSQSSPQKSTDEPKDDVFIPAITMELKVSKNKITGNITEISPDDLTDDKVKIEEGEITGNTFKLLTYRKANGLQFPIRWTGTILSDKSLKVTRKNSSGKVLDQVEEVPLTRVK